MAAIVAEINSAPLGLVVINAQGQAWDFAASPPGWDAAAFGGNPDAAHLLPLARPFPAASASGYLQWAQVPDAAVQVSGAFLILYALTAAGAVVAAPASAICTVPISTIPPFVQLTSFLAR